MIYIRGSSNTNFYRYVGFTITRKQARLENYFKRNTGAPTLPQMGSPSRPQTIGRPGVFLRERDSPPGV